MTKLSVNINKVATLRNARGGNNPDVVQVALDCEKFGAQGITVHPRPDERHIRYQDVYDLKAVLRTEFNIEGNPVDKFNDLVLKVRPTQVTLVPDAPDQITSNAGWDTKKNLSFLTEIIGELRKKGFVLPFLSMPKRRWWNMRRKRGQTGWNFIRSRTLRLMQEVRRWLFGLLWKHPERLAVWGWG